MLLYDCQAVQDIADDFESMFPKCREVTKEYSKGRKSILLIWQCILRLFAPLM